MMKITTFLKPAALVVGALLLLAGCGQQAEQSEPAEQVEQAAAPVEKKMPATEKAPSAEEEEVDLLKIKEAAMKEKEIIASETAEMETLVKQKAEIPLTEQMGEEAKSLTQQITDKKNSIKEHKDRYNEYIEQLKAGNVDTSELQM